MYQLRFILFIDILGFRNVITKTEFDSSLAESLYTILNSLKSESVSLESFGSVNKEVVEANGRNLEDVMRTAALFNSAIRKKHPLNVTHFSDSLVISCDANNETTCFVVFDFIARLNYRLWHEHKILMRGGITVGKLTHEENGPLFGPAMVKAYDIESKVAKFPRVLIDNAIVPRMKTSENYHRMQALFNNAEDGYLEISLASSLSFLIQSPHSMHELMQRQYMNVLKDAPVSLEIIKAAVEPDNEKSKDIIAKYDWLIEKISLEYVQLTDKINGKFI